MIRRFKLVRHADVSGVSGTGHVADGVIWPDGTATVRWRGDHPSTVSWDGGQASVEHVHGHGGATEIVWFDPEPSRSEAADQLGVCDVAVWDGPYRMNCGYVLTNGRCPSHGQQVPRGRL